MPLVDALRAEWWIDMSTLNSTETKQLGDVKALLEYILRNGYDPEKASGGNLQEIQTEKILRETKDVVHTILTMKGHYPS